MTKITTCNICNKETVTLFKTKVLRKYIIQYFKCPHCEFIQTENPFWLLEAYQESIANLDVGLVSRNIDFSKKTFNLITVNLKIKGKYLDYGGGTGLFTRLIRDLGLDYYSYDKYTENLFTKNFNLKTPKSIGHAEAITAFEVFEHFASPIAEIKKLLAITNTIIFSTDLIPTYPILDSKDWWYFIPDIGQHISFYSTKTLKYIANIFGLLYYNQNGLHIFSKLMFKDTSTISLLDQDFKLIQGL